MARSAWSSSPWSPLAAVVVVRGRRRPQRAAHVHHRSTTTTSTATPTTTTTAPPRRRRSSPLTGLPLARRCGPLDRPALAVKIDNLDAPSRDRPCPQTGLPKADVVFEEIVEGDITRLVAIFHSQTPGKVGPVRSARTTDVHLLPTSAGRCSAGPAATAASSAPCRGSRTIIDVGADAVPGAYSRDRSRRAPHNLYADTDQLWARPPAGTPAARPLFRYRPAGQGNPPTAEPAQGVDITWGGGAASVAGELALGRRAPGRTSATSTAARTPTPAAPGSSAKNVVVMATEYGQSAADLRSPEAHTVGSGRAVRVHQRRRHPRPLGPARHRQAGLARRRRRASRSCSRPGSTWVELPRPGGIATVARLSRPGPVERASGSRAPRP